MKMYKSILFIVIICMFGICTSEDSKLVTLKLNKRSNTKRNLKDTQSSDRFLANSETNITLGVRPTIKILSDFEELYETELFVGLDKKKVKFIIDINSTYVAIDKEDSKRLLSSLDPSFQISSQANETNAYDERNLENETAYLEILGKKTLGTLTTQNVSMNGTHYWSMTILELDNSNGQSGAKQPNVLGLRSLQTPGPVLSLVDHLWDASLITSKYFQLNFYPSGDSSIVFGGNDHTKHSKLKIKLDSNSSWAFTLDSSSFFSDYYPKGEIVVHISNTLSHIILPRSVFKSFMRDLNEDTEWGTSDSSGNTACYWHSSDDFPKLKFAIRGTKSKFTIYPRNYVKRNKKVWELLIDFAEDEEIGTNVMFIGYPFFRRFYTYFDKDYLYAIDYSKHDKSSSFLDNPNLFMLTIILSLFLIY